MNLGDLVISTSAVKLESTSNYFVPEGYPSVASYEVVLAMVEAAARLKAPHHVGITASAYDVLYELFFISYSAVVASMEHRGVLYLAFPYASPIYPRN